MSQAEDPRTPLPTMSPVVVRPAGELDLMTAPELRQRLDAAIVSGSDVVLDLRGLDFMDVAGIHVVLAADDRARRGGRQLRLIRGGAPVDLLFALTGLETRLSFADPELVGAVDAQRDALEPAGGARGSAAAAQLAAPVGADTTPGAARMASIARPGGTVHSADAAREARTEARLLAYFTSGGPVA